MKTAKVTRTTNDLLKITWDPRHLADTTKEQHSALMYDIGTIVRSHCSFQWKSWRAVSAEVKVGVRHELSTKYIHELFSGRFTQWKSNFHKHYKKYEDPEVALAVGCPKELVNRPED
ncbi:hypothetical protein D8674_008495 [Pyrus ussuriensis x Pyrus communis]|uniref:Uncharacterized protein n=1 Tax=Pyrus ussuriensis x Pyrus communis TaxID=2448454 RepID=A0A5N5HSX6_9ROSA|nr:hypothetical protein D8674_008495 [Pyrus ussuriensis x Pyrus communis]